MNCRRATSVSNADEHVWHPWRVDTATQDRAGRDRQASAALAGRAKAPAVDARPLPAGRFPFGRLGGRERRHSAGVAVPPARTAPPATHQGGHAPPQRRRHGDIDPGCLELAHGGTIFLAKVDTIGYALQGRLLEFLETGDIRRVGESYVHRKVDVRVIASADNGPSAGWLERGLREDLFYRLNIIHLVVLFHRRNDRLYRQWLATRRLQTVCA